MADEQFISRPSVPFHLVVLLSADSINPPVRFACFNRWGAPAGGRGLTSHVSSANSAAINQLRMRPRPLLFKPSIVSPPLPPLPSSTSCSPSLSSPILHLLLPSPRILHRQSDWQFYSSMKLNGSCSIARTHCGNTHQRVEMEQEQDQDLDQKQDLDQGQGQDRDQA